MKELKLTNSDILCLVDDEDYNRCVNYSKWYLGNGHISSTKRPSLPIQRFILNLSFLDKFFIDHKDGNIFNNKKSNYRKCNHRKNMQNQRKHLDNKSGYKGVAWNKRVNKFVCRIIKNGEQISLGYFKDKVLAAIAYDDAAILHFGEFAKLNFPLYGA